MNKQFDVVIFGASGFTGKYTVLEAINVLQNLKWGIAGRNKENLESVLIEMGQKSGTDLSNIPIIIADVNDADSLEEMAKQCKVVVNCCGPFRYLGEAVVKACINSGTHLVDVSGEREYMERMQLEYDSLAKKNGVYIVSACGFDSIPADMGVVFVEKHFNGVVNSVETFVSFRIEGDHKGGAIMHVGTWESAILGLANKSELKDLRAKLFKTNLPEFEPKLAPRRVLECVDLVQNQYCLPFVGPDKDVLTRTQRILFENEQKRPIQVNAYMVFPSMLRAISLLVFGVYFALMSHFSFTRKLLLKYPKFFSFGMASNDGPLEDVMENSKFSITLNAEGWDKKDNSTEVTDHYSYPTNKTMIAKVSGTNPGYGATCVALLVSAVTILRESDKLPENGGVFSPGAIFAKTNMIAELEKYENGLKFEIISVRE